MSLDTIQLNPVKYKDILTPSISLRYQIFGQPLQQAPVVLVNHALTGNSEVAGPDGWWKNLIGNQKTIDLNRYTVIAFNIPWNGFRQNEVSLPEQYRFYSTRLVAELFWLGLDNLKIKEIHTIIGGSIGGSIGWEMSMLRPESVKNLIPIACSIKASDWLIGNVLVQDMILNNSVNPIEDARKHAMLLYRTPESLDKKFKGIYNIPENQYAIESWLNYHGDTLKNRFSLNSYKIINNLLRTIGQDLTEQDIMKYAALTNANIHIIAVNTDYMFTKMEQLNIFDSIRRYKKEVRYSEIQSIHGHDAFLIEYDQLNSILKNNF